MVKHIHSQVPRHARGCFGRIGSCHDSEKQGQHGHEDEDSPHFQDIVYAASIDSLVYDEGHDPRHQHLHQYFQDHKYRAPQGCLFIFPDRG